MSTRLSAVCAVPCQLNTLVSVFKLKPCLMFKLNVKLAPSKYRIFSSMFAAINSSLAIIATGTPPTLSLATVFAAPKLSSSVMASVPVWPCVLV